MARMDWMVFLGGLAACNGQKDEDPGPDEADTDTDTDSDTDADTDADSDADTDADTDTDGLAITGVTGTVNATVGTVVVAAWDQSEDATVHLEYGFDAGITVTSPERVLAAGPHEELLLGVPYDTDVTWRIVAVGAEDTVTTPDTVTRTALVPPELPIPQLGFADPAGYDPALPWLLVSQHSSLDYERMWTLVLDRQARVVWALETPPDRFTIHVQLSYGGDAFLIDHNSLFAIFDGGDAAEVVETKIDGSEVHRFATPGAHQPHLELPDGSLAYARIDPDNEDVALVERNGTVTTIFDCDGWADEIGAPNGCASNTLSRDPATGNLWLTVYSLASVVEFDPITGEALRWFGDLPGSWAFDPPGAELHYPHSVYISAAGTMMVSDFADFPPAEAIVREYTLDPVTETATEIFRFGEGEGIVGYGYGDVFRTPNGNTQQNCGVSRIREVTPAGDVVWDLGWTGSTQFFVGRSTPFADLYAFAPDRL